MRMQELARVIEELAISGQKGKAINRLKKEGFPNASEQLEGLLSIRLIRRRTLKHPIRFVQ
jgi:hypothetical protein